MELLRIKDLMKERGLTGKDLAEKIGVHPVNLSKIINGNAFPKPDLLKRIAEVLDVDIRELFNRTKEEVPLNGFVEYEGEIFKVTRPEDLEKLIKKVS